MIIPGMVSATFKDKSVEQIIQLCTSANLRAIEWSENVHIMPGDPKGALTLYEMTKSAGLEIAAYGSYYRLGEYENPKEVFSISLQSAVALKAPVIRVWAGTRPSTEADDTYRNKLAKEALLLSNLAQKEGIKVAFEWHKNTLTDTNDSAMLLLEAAGADNLYCLWQPTAALNMEERTKGIQMLGNRLLNFHIYYWKEGVRRPLAEGVGEWEQYLSEVNCNRNRYGLLEFVMDNLEEQFMEDVKILHQLCQMPSK